MPLSTTTLTITNPLILYRSHISAQRLLPDPNQYRIALLLQSVYTRLLDYQPPPDLDHRLRRLSRALESQRTEHATSLSTLRALLSRDRRDSTALIRVLSSKQSALASAAPRGFYLYGGVGTGKSLLLDLLYSSLPHHGKRRWHFHAFMLQLYRQLHAAPQQQGVDEEYVLMSVARDLLTSYPIVFLDEMQFPDRASARIISELLVRFWSLGGVLIASSNRPPREITKAAGTRAEREFVGFADVLEGRCEVCRIEGARDWRRERGNGKGWWRVGSEMAKDVGAGGIEDWKVQGEGLEYFFTATSSLEGLLPKEAGWMEDAIRVYSRRVKIPHFHPSTKSAVFRFGDLCEAELGPADYLALCAKVRTLYVTGVPELRHPDTKNEARRFISLLDAVYESGVRLALSSLVPLSDIFPTSPIHNSRSRSAPVSQQRQREWDLTGDSDLLYHEVFSTAHRDVTTPFRPNIGVTTEGTVKDEDEGLQGEECRGKEMEWLGEDERFAARRAESRVWEVCSRGWWEGIRWTPQHPSPQAFGVRTEREKVEVGKGGEDIARVGEEENGHVEEKTAVQWSPFRKMQGDPPRFDERHVWALGMWGARAGVWGKGVAAERGERETERQEREKGK